MATLQMDKRHLLVRCTYLNNRESVQTQKLTHGRGKVSFSCTYLNVIIAVYDLNAAAKPKLSRQLVLLENECRKLFMVAF